MIEASLVCFESSSSSFHLSPNIDEGFRLSGSWYSRISKVSKHEVEFRAHEEIHTFLEMPGVLPPMFLSQGISFCYGLSFCLREVEDIPEFFFKEKDFLYRSTSVDLDHLRDEQMFFLSPSIHMFEQPPFHLPEFFSVQCPAFSLKRLSKLNQTIFKVMPDPLHDMEVVILEGGLGPDFTYDFWESGPKVKDDAIGMDVPAIELSEKPFGDATAVKPGDRFDIKDSNLLNISGDLFVSTSSSRHIFINGEGSRELELS